MGRRKGKGRGAPTGEPASMTTPGAAASTSTAGASGEQKPSSSKKPAGRGDGGAQSQRSGSEGSVGAVASQLAATSLDKKGAAALLPSVQGKKMPFKVYWTRKEGLVSKVGKEGTPITVLTNYYKLLKCKDWILCMYHVDFNLDDELTAKKKMLMRQHKKLLGDYIFDGMQLYTTKKLKKLTELKSKDPETGENYVIKLTFIKELDSLDMQFFQIMNIILRRCQDHIGLKLLGRNYYDPALSTSEKAMDYQGNQFNFDIWPGYLTSIRHHEQEILLNADLTYKFLRKQTVLEELMRLSNQNKGPKALVGAIVLTKYNNKTYRVDDIDHRLSINSQFSYQGNLISYREYYKNKYQIDLRNIKQPLLMSKPKPRDIRRGMTSNLYLIPEICYMTGIPDEVKDYRQGMQALSTYMKTAPDSRCNALKAFNRKLLNNEKVQVELSSWGLNLQTKLIQIPARILPREPITQQGRECNYLRSNLNSEWAKEIRSLKMNYSVELQNWTFLYPQYFEREALNLLQFIKSVGPPMGIQVAQPKMIPLQRDDTRSYTNEMGGCAGQQLVMCLLTNNSTDKYSALKKFATVNLGIASQMVLKRTAGSKENTLRSIATKIIIQINCKLGGEVWNVAIPLNNTMVIGYDVYHDSLDRKASYGATISSLNKNCTQYYGQVARHHSKEELSSNFTAATRRCLQAYRSRNKNVDPTTVIVFRDGVGDGQIKHVKEIEIDDMKKGLKAEGLTKAKMAFIIVSKRINTRIFGEDPKQQPKTFNPVPGTVVDDVITLPEKYDFFLVSQTAREGTVSPTSYNVIEDTTNLQPAHMQRLAYKLTHLYYNWQGTIRVPAPCMYAHKLAYITGQSLHVEPRQELWGRLWYL